MSITSDLLYEKILSLYPEITKHNIELTITHDDQQDAWVATFNKNKHELTTYIEMKDAEDCLAGIKCVYLGTQIGQFVFNYCSEGKEC